MKDVGLVIAVQMVILVTFLVHIWKDHPEFSKSLNISNKEKKKVSHGWFFILLAWATRVAINSDGKTTNGAIEEGRWGVRWWTCKIWGFYSMKMEEEDLDVWLWSTGEVWVSDRNIGVARLYVILKVLRLDKITKEISVDGGKKMTKNWVLEQSNMWKSRRKIMLKRAQLALLREGCYHGSQEKKELPEEEVNLPDKSW